MYGCFFPGIVYRQDNICSATGKKATKVAKLDLHKYIKTPAYVELDSQEIPGIGSYVEFNIY